MPERITGQVTRINRTDAQLASALVASSTENLLIKGDFSIVQRGAQGTPITAVDDDTYNIDRWVVISEANGNVDVESDNTSAEIPTGARAACELTVTATNNAKFGIVQVIENKNCAHVLGGNVSLSFEAKQTVGSSMTDIRAAVISWDGTADTITSDVVGTWQDSSTNPTLITSPNNWVYENTPAALTLTSSYQKFTINNISIDTSGATNIAVFIWQNDTLSTTDNNSISIANVNLINSAVAADFVPRDFGDELRKCRRYYQQNITAAQKAFGAGVMNLTTVGLCVYQYETMRIAPVGTVSAAADFQLVVGGGTAEVTSMSIDDETVDSAVLNCTVSGPTEGQGTYCRDDGNGLAKIFLTAEL